MSWFHHWLTAAGLPVCHVMIGLLVAACADTPMFPRDVLEKVDQAVTFEKVIANPAAYTGRTIQFGGQIVESRVDQDKVQMLVRELPIRTHPVYGPVDAGTFRGMFVVQYVGQVGLQDVQYGNMLVVVGTVAGAVPTTLTGAPVRRPMVEGECLRIWRTQGDQIDDFPWLPSVRYWPLIQHTFCTTEHAVVLPVS